MKCKLHRGGAICLGLIVALANAQAQSGVKLSAATAIVGGKPEVRLRWQIKEGWMPAGGLKLYRVAGNSKELVKAIQPPTDAVIDGLLPKPFQGRRLATKASNVVPPGIPIDLDTPRPPSSFPEFDKRRGALDDLRNLRGPFLPREKVNIRTQKMAVARPPQGKATVQSRRTQLPPAVKTTLDARVELHLASMLDSQNASIIGLGAADTTVKAGQSVSYALFGIGAGGQETAQPLATLNNFVVGADAQPPAPSGIVFAQDEDAISLRWARPTKEMEQSLLNASYQVFRVDPPNPAQKKLSTKPIVIMSLPGNKEPVAFFTTKIKSPGTFTYRIVLVDGFDRESPPGAITVNAADWRQPDKPRRAGTSLGASFVTAFQGVSFGQKKLPSNFASLVLRPTVAWVPGNAPDDMPVKFNVYRSDMDNPAAAPVKLTASPISGTPVPVSTDAQLESALDLILGYDRDNKIKAEVDRVMAREATTPDQVRDRAIDSAKINARYTAQKASLKALFRNNPPLTFEDATAQKDRKYLYFVTALYTTNGLETEEISAGELDVPDFAKPPVVSGIESKFTAAPPRTLVYRKLPPKTSFKDFAGPLILQRKKQARQKATNAVGLGLRGTFLELSPTVKLALLPNDDGGYVDLSWTPVPNLRSVQYRIRRKTGTLSFSDVGITTAGVAKFRDTVPKSRSRTYDYQIVAVSRWGIEGNAASMSVTVPATVPPDKPNVVSATPGDDREILLFIEVPSVDQGVTQYTILRDGQALSQKFTNANPVNGLLKFSDKNLQPGKLTRYAVKAETAAGVQSAASEEVQCAALKLITAPPTGLTGQPTATNATPPGVVLSWTAAAGADHYLVRRRASANGPATVLAAKVQGTTFTDVFASRGKTYFYEVLAVDASGNVSTQATTTVSVPGS